MKLLIFSPYYPPHIGGLESHSDEFNKYLSGTSTLITVFTPRLPKEAPIHETRHHNVKVIRFPAFELISNYPVPKFWDRQFWQMLRSLKKERPDIVITRTRFFLSSLLGLSWAKIHHKPIIHIEHGSDFVKLQSFFSTFCARLYDHIFGRIVLRYSTLNISISRAVQSFVRRFDKRPSPLIYRGIHFEPIDEALPADEIAHRFQGKTILITVARLYHWKGVHQSIEALKKLSPQERNLLVFLVVGNGEDFERLKNEASGLPVEFLGNRSREEVFRILKASDIYLHSSLPGGGLSTSLLEAMYAGLAVIATPHEGAREVVEDGQSGFLISESDPTLFTDRISILLHDKKHCEQLGTKGREHIRQHFDWNKAIECYIKLFRNL